MIVSEPHGDPLPIDVRDVLNRDERNAVLTSLNLESGPDSDFQNVVSLASDLLGTKVALVTLLDREQQTFHAKTGTTLTGSPADVSFCAHAIAQPGDDAFVVENAAKDPRFEHNPLVTGEPKIRFYAGVPMTVMGEKIGTLCVIDTIPRPRPTDVQLKQLQQLAGLAATLFKLKDSANRGDKARAALVREEKRHTLALEAANIASWVWDLRTGMIECDELMPRFFGLPHANRIPSLRIFRAIDRRDTHQALRNIRDALESGNDYTGEYRIHNVAPTRWLAARGRVLDRDADGRPLLVVGVNFDITDTKTFEERQRLLLREINHRVKNTLATVQALATQTVRHAKEPRNFLEAFTGRLQALGLAHGLLSDREWGGIDLTEVVRLQVMPFTQADAPRILATGDRVLLSPDQALALGLILHELASNALKHGALSVPLGHVEISWSVTGILKPRLTLTWQEVDGPRVMEPTRTGFGSILIRRSLDKVLTSEVKHSFLPEGVRAEISVPLER